LSESEKLKAKAEAQRRAAEICGLGAPYYLNLFDEKIVALPFQIKAFETAAEWIRDPSRNLIITGPVGTGKTLIAARSAYFLAREVRFSPRWEGDNFFKSRRSVRFISAPIILDELRRQFGKELRHDQTLEDLFVKPGILFLDDFDKINPTAWSCERLWIILNDRMVLGSPVCITSNLNLDQIDAKYGDAIASRLANNCRLIELDGEDQRVRV